MKVFFTKKQKKLMRDRRRKKKLALAPYSRHVVPTKSNNGGATMKGCAGGEDVVQEGQGRNNGTPSSNKRPRGAAFGDHPPTQNHEHDSAVSFESTVDHGVVHRISVPDNLTPKEAKKFRKDERRKARHEGYEVEFREASKDSKNGPNPEGGGNDDSPHKPAKKRRKLDADAFPRINDLVRQAAEQRGREERRKAAADEEEKLSDADKRRYVALDCEMVGVGTDGKKSALARVSLVDWDGQVLLDTFVQVPDRVVDFRTQFSGVRPKDIKESRNAMKPEDVRERVAALVKDRILVGHALHNDLSVLMLQHPKGDIRDTAKYRPFQRYHLKWRPRKLRDLVKEHLGKVIQDGSHDSTVDAASTMQLFRLVRKEWEQELAEKKVKHR